MSKCILNDDANDSFNSLTKELANETLYYHPSSNRPLILTIDAPNFCIASSLHQLRGNIPDPIDLFSKFV